MKQLDKIRADITNHPTNKWAKKKGWIPIYAASPKSKIVIIGQAPGIKAQESKIPWNDISGKNLREWLGITDDQFYDDSLISLLPMDFYYPGKAKTGDVPPRKDFAPMWHKQILDEMPDVELIILIGMYAQKYYLVDNSKKNLTENIRSYKEFLPEYFPIVHPSPLTARWQAKNSWFKKEVLPELRNRVSRIL